MRELARTTYSRLLLYRTRLEQTNPKTTTWRLIVGVLFLSSMMVFSFPPPIRPRTSIGLMGMMLLVLLVLVSIQQRKRIASRIKSPVLIDFAVLLFLIGNLISTLIAPTLYQPVNIRIIVYAALFYFIMRIVPVSVRLMDYTLKYISHFAIFVSGLSLTQLIFPSILNAVAADYFSGRESYGLTVEFNRGRLFPWGATVLLAPFFLVYATPGFLAGGRARTAYFLFGFSTITASLVASNFRWTFLVYVGIFLLMMGLQKVHQKITRKQFYVFVVMMLTIVWIGLVTAEKVFGYNLVDRFILRQHHRDVTETLGRFYLNDQAIDVFLSRPLFGAGPGNYFDMVHQFIYLKYFSIHDQFEPVLVPTSSHNEFFSVLAESGILGFVAFLLFVYLAMRKVYEVSLNRDGLSYEQQQLFLAILGFYVSLLFYTMFENLFPQNYVFLFGLTAILFTWMDRTEKYVVK